jgi:hypothetical protein
MIYELLKKEAAHDNAKDYDVSVDGLKVISRNNDPVRFYEFEQFVLPESRTITINVYEHSHRCTRYILLLQNEEATLDGLGNTENTIVARMKQERLKWDYKKLEEDNDNLIQKLGECEEFARGLEQKVSELEQEKSKSSGQLTSSIVSLVGTALSNNPDALSGIPIIGSLFGGKKMPASLNGPKQECLCSTAPKDYTGELTVGDELRMKMALVPYFREEYREKVMKILLQFHGNNLFVDQAYSNLEVFLERQKKQTTDKKVA